MDKQTDKHIRYDIERIRQIAITDVVDKFDTTIRKGARHISYCPWHEDHRPSLTIYDTKDENHVYCFACQNGGDAIAYVMQHEGVDFVTACAMLSQEFGIPALEGRALRTAPVSRRIHKDAAPKKIAYIKLSYVESMMSMDNSFCQCLCHVFGKELATLVAEDYMLGSYELWDGTSCVTFPSIDTNLNVRNIKVQSYCSDIRSPQFFHSETGKTLWLFSILQKKGMIPSDCTFDGDCLFGAHLLMKHPNATVMLVESPKNAVVGACACPQYVWVATGNKGQLKASVLTPLRGRRVVVYPDRDAIGDWRKALEGMPDAATFQISDFCEAVAPAGMPKYDIADFIIDAKMKK